MGIMEKWSVEKVVLEKKRQKRYHENRRKITCNKCGNIYTSGQELKDLRCPKCNSNESFSIR